MRLTEYLAAIPIPNKNVNTVAKAIFKSFVLKNGVMKTFITDMGKEYKNSLTSDICKYLKIKMTHQLHTITRLLE